MPSLSEFSIPPRTGGPKVNAHDVVIVGGSLAGSACAREFARLGIDAVALERDRFPRDKVCGGFVSPGGVKCLDRLGVLDRVRAAGAVKVKSARIRAGSRDVHIPFERPGLGISRGALDAIVADHAAVRTGCHVHRVRREGDAFVVETGDGDIRCAVVIDAAGKLSRFTPRTSITEEQFGTQHFEPGDRGDALEFSFSVGVYGGAVSVEGGRSNFSFLINKNKLPGHLGRPGQLVTGPVAYQRVASGYIAIGDAAGMVDPFCGEGMRHALDSGMTAAGMVARGIAARKSYEEVRWDCEREWLRRWERKRLVTGGLRRLMEYPAILAAGLPVAARSVLRELWA